MIRLTDGTIVNLSDEGMRFFQEVVGPDATKKGKLKNMVKVSGYRSKSTGEVSNVTIRLRQNLDEIIVQAIQVVKDKDTALCADALKDKGVTQEIADAAKLEVLASLSESLVGDHSKDVSSRSSAPLIDGVPGVMVGLSNSNVQLKGFIVQRVTVKPGEKKKTKHRPKTLAKRWFERGTYRQAGCPGSFITLSLRPDGFDHLTCNSQELGSSHFASPLAEPTTPKVAAGEDKVDAVFIIDTTGSNRANQPVIRENLGNMIDLLGDVDCRVGFVFQGDYCDNKKLVTCYEPAPLEDARTILNQNHDTYGGDSPEAYEVGLNRARCMPFRPGAKRVIVMVLDSVPHKYADQYGMKSGSMDQVRLDFDEEMESAIANSIDVHFLATAQSRNASYKWGLKMAAGNEVSQAMNLRDRQDMPIVLAGIISAEVGHLESFTIKAKARGVISEAAESALRVFKEGKRGYSERMMVTEDTGDLVEVVAKYSRKAESPISVSQARKMKRLEPKMGSAFTELTQTTTLKAPVLVASLCKKGKRKGKAIVRKLNGEGKIRIGPDAHGQVFVKTRFESRKTVKTGESVIFLDI
jgi:hypothetical protein